MVKESMPISLSSHSSPFGNFSCACTENEIVALHFGDEAESRLLDAVRRWGYAPTASPHGAAARVRQELEEYFAGKRRQFTLAPRFYGTPFQLRVWQSLMTVPYGTVVTYGELAQLAGYPRAARAVGTAMANNRIAIIVPCHRVVGSHGAPGGYGYGLAMKQALLALERGAPHEENTSATEPRIPSPKLGQA